MNDQKYKRNHWVPQAYLRTFASDANRKKIWVFGKTSGAPALKPISKVAVRFYLYAPQEEGGKRDYEMEHKLGGLEQLFGMPFWSQINAGYVDFTQERIRKGGRSACGSNVSTQSKGA